MKVYIRAIIDRMVTKLHNVLKFQHQTLEHVKDPAGIVAIITAANLLKPVEDEILLHPEGSIDFMKSGNRFVTGFPDELSNRISKLLE